MDSQKMDSQKLEAARAVAFRYFGYAARSRAEIQRRLEQEGFEIELIDAVLEEFVHKGWLDDAKFAHDWVADRADRKRYGKSRLAGELLRKGVDREVIEEVLSSVNEQEELKRARNAIDRKWQAEAVSELNLDAQKAEMRRCANFLQRRGFDWSIITKVLGELTAKDR